MENYKYMKYVKSKSAIFKRKSFFSSTKAQQLPVGESFTAKSYVQKCLSRLRSPANSVASHRFTPLRSFRETNENWASWFAGKVLGDLKKTQSADKMKEKSRPIKYVCALLEFEYIVSESVMFRRCLFLLI